MSTDREILEKVKTAIDAIGVRTIRIEDHPCGPRLLIGSGGASFAFVSREGEVQLSRFVPGMWCRKIRLAVQAAGLAYHKCDHDLVRRQHAGREAARVRNGGRLWNSNT